MARCGCSGVCACLVRGGAGVEVQGNGSPGSPYIVSFVGGDPASCKAVMTCVSGALGPGLAWNAQTGRIQVKISGDAGNGTVFGSDNGIYSSGGGGGGSDLWPTTTVENLPASGMVLGNSGAAFMLPFNTVASTNYAVQQKVDAITTLTCSSWDGQSLVVQYLDNRLATRTNLLSTVPDNQTAWKANSSTYTTLTLVNGTQNPNWQWQDIPGYPKAMGWYGFMSGEEKQMTLQEQLHIVAGRIVVFVVVTSALDADAAVQAIQQEGAQKWTVVQGNSVDALATAKSAGLKTCFVALHAADVPDKTVLKDYDFALLSATGWTDAELTDVIGAGNKVILGGASRQVDMKRSKTLGAMGVESGDPVYTRGNTADYRRFTDAWAWADKAYGQLSRENYDTFSVIGGNVSAYPQAWDGTAGIQLAPWFEPSAWRASYLLGWLCPVVETSYEVTFQMQFAYAGTAPAGPLGGLAICCDTDEATTTRFTDPDNMARIVRNGGYYVQKRIAGDLLVYCAPNRTGPFKSVTQAATPIASTEWRYYTVRVEPAGLTFIEMKLDGTVLATLSFPDTEFRGGYLHLMKENSGFDFELSFRAMSFTNLT